LDILATLSDLLQAVLAVRFSSCGPRSDWFVYHQCSAFWWRIIDNGNQ